MKASPLPESRQQLLVGDPLYTRYELGATEWGGLIRRALENGALDVYCAECGRPSVFRVESGHGRDELAQKLAVKTWFTVEARCTRDHRAGAASGRTDGRCEGRYVVLFARDGAYACKAGIYPSKAVIDLAGLDPEVTGELDAGLREDLGRAVGLRGAGVGTGAFVYLRRVFEALLEQARERARRRPGFDDAAYRTADGAGRIALLAGELPPRVVENAARYAVLDRGVHELDEAEGLACFDLLLISIDLVLRERLESRLFAGAVARAGREPAGVE